jgi:hypothetical protein
MDNDNQEDKSYQKEDIFSPAYFQKVQQQRALKESQTNPSAQETKINYGMENYASVGIVACGVLGVTVLTIPHVWPALGVSSFLGVDFALWYDFIALVAWGSGVALIPPLFWKASGNHKERFPLLKRLWGFLPRYGSYSPRIFIASLVLSQMFFISNHFTHQPLQSMDTWRTLEAQHLDSRDPAKRALFLQEKQNQQNKTIHNISPETGEPGSIIHSNPVTSAPTISEDTAQDNHSENNNPQTGITSMDNLVADTQNNMQKKHYSDAQIQQVTGLFKSAKEIGKTLKESQNQEP